MSLTQDEMERRIKAAEQLCEIYFDIAAKHYGVEVVRKMRDERIKEIKEGELKCAK